MPNQLRDIRKFTDLVRCLEMELEWPVEAHRGKIQIKSRRGHGTVVANPV